MDSNDSQFNMWNDFDESFPFLCVNELFPILIVFNRFNPSILNVCTDPKQSLSISINSNDVKLDKSKAADSWNTPSPNVMDCRLGKSNHYSFNIISIPRITNELPKKLYESFPIVPI